MRKWDSFKPAEFAALAQRHYDATITAIQDGNESLLLKLSTETGSLVRIFRSWFLQLLLIAVDLKERLQVNKHQMENVGHH